VIGAAALFALGLMALRWAMGFPYPSFFIPAVLLVTAGASGFATLIAPEAWSGTRTGRSVSRIGLLAVMGAAATAISGAVGAFGGYRLSVIELLVILGAGMVVSIGVISRRRVAADLPHPTP
jgi:hypothetical protein